MFDTSIASVFNIHLFICDCLLANHNIPQQNTKNIRGSGLSCTCARGAISWGPKERSVELQYLQSPPTLLCRLQSHSGSVDRKYFRLHNPNFNPSNTYTTLLLYYVSEICGDSRCPCTEAHYVKDTPLQKESNNVFNTHREFFTFMGLRQKRGMQIVAVKDTDMTQKAKQL